MDNNQVSKRFHEDFKKMVVELYQSGKSVKSLSSEFNVSEVTIYKWIKKYAPVELEDGTVVTLQDFIKLQEQINRLKEENEILKKAMAIVARK
ncbi:transposase [Neobacillus mesonae]|uniref:transposase n=1 Tax=Neobacillus mesonae TaxID=1193713 RepID=UPI0037CB4B19